MKKIFILSLIWFAAATLFAQKSKYEQGVAAFNQKNNELAYSLLSEDLAEHPKHVEAYCCRALLQTRWKKAAKALGDANLAVKYLSPKDKPLTAYVHYVRAFVFTQMEEYGNAIADLNISIRNDTSRVDYRLERASCYQLINRHAAAETDYKQALKSYPANIRAWIGLGQVLQSQNKLREATDCMNQWLQVSPRNPSVYYYKAKMEYGQKQYDAAIADMLQVLQLDDSRPQMYDLFQEYAQTNYAFGLAKLAELIKEYPNYDRWYFVRANLLYSKGDYALAINDYTRFRALTDSANKTIILESRASCYTETGNYPLAMADYTESLKTDSANAYLFGGRGDLFRLMGDYAAAERDFCRAIQLDSTQVWFYYRRGWIRDEFLNNKQDALSDYNRGIAVDKNYAYTYLHRGMLFEKDLKNTAKAQADYEMVLKLDTAIKESGNCRQYALYQLGQIDKAFGWLNKIIERYPTAWNYYDAACLYGRMHKPSESISSLRHAFERGYSEFVHLSKDDDLENVRNLPEFKALVEEWRVKNEKKKAAQNNELIITSKTLIE